VQFTVRLPKDRSVTSKRENDLTAASIFQMTLSTETRKGCSSELNRDTKLATCDLTFSMASVPGRESRIDALTLAVWARTPFFHNTTLSRLPKTEFQAQIKPTAPNQQGDGPRISCNGGAGTGNIIPNCPQILGKFKMLVIS
jgi:hypothetical protein